MAKLQTESITITLSKIIKNNEKEQVIISAELIESLEAVIAELAGTNVTVEIE